MGNNKQKKTGIDGLDKLFFGGILLKEPSEEKGLLTLARGIHGVNKVHLAMQMCEGICNNIPSNDKPKADGDGGEGSFKKGQFEVFQPSMVFISLNKDKDLLKNSYYDYYIQRWIRDVREKDESKPFKNISWIEGESKLEQFDVDTLNNIKNGKLFFDFYTHSLCERGHVENNIKYGYNISDNPEIEILGRENLCGDNQMADGLTLFLKMLEVVDKYEGKGIKCIMVDGLSCLTHEEIKQCPFAALSESLRKSCDFGVITADEKLLPSDIRVDIVIDMAIKEAHDPEQQYTALRISKCLYQKNAYGWHNYKMRSYGIEVIPSIQLQMNSRYHMDNAVPDALLLANEIPITSMLEDYHTNNENKVKNKTKDQHEIGELYYKKDSSPNAMNNLFNNIRKKYESDPVLIVELKKNRYESYAEFFNNINEAEKKEYENLHIFNFMPGNIWADDFLYTIDKQVHAIARKYHELANEKIQLTDIQIEDAIKNIELTDEQKKDYTKDAKLDDTIKYLNNIPPTDSSHSKYETKKRFLERLDNGKVIPDFLTKEQLKDAIKKIEITEEQILKIIHIIIGDINYINYAYPCLAKDKRLLPALAAYTKKHHMTNYIHTTFSLPPRVSPLSYRDVLSDDVILFKQLKEVATKL